VKKFSFVILAILSVGCMVKPYDPGVVAYNKQHLSGEGDEIGTLPDGRKVIRYELSRGDYPSHTIYIVDATNTVTVNRPEKSGKNYINRAEAVIIINGVRFVPEQKEQAEKNDSP
jgi:hypothetical protein